MFKILREIFFSFFTEHRSVSEATLFKEKTEDKMIEYIY